MMAKDSVKNRMENGISFTEFSYQLMQGYDFYWLYKNKGCKIQMGGSDQWGNITTGTELIRRMDGGDVWALTCPLLTKADGQKFGKSEQGNIWLDAQMTSPYKFYQFWLNVNDADLPKLMRVFLLETQGEIEGWEQTHAQNPNALKRILAEKLTERVHSLADLQQAQQASGLLFGKSTLADFEQTPEPILHEVFETLPAKSFTTSEFESIPTNLDLLAAVIPLSKSELRRLVKGNGISINKGKINEAQANEKPSFPLLKNKYLLLQKGAKEYFLVKINE
jgi:tyrosyl-tRNA synthetase